MGGCDAIIFTAGLGENQSKHRQAICDQLSCFGVKVDPELNKKMVGGNEGKISAPDSKVEVYVIPTNEELVIARDTQAIINAL